MTYEEFYETLSHDKRHRLNETIIWAVNKMVETESNISGSSIFLGERRQQLIEDQKVAGWRRAIARFRKSVDRWVENHREVPPNSGNLLLRGM
jgi:hypothetical protein